MDSLPVRAEVIGTVAAPFAIGGATPHRLLCRGQTPPFLGRSFRSGSVLGNAVPATGVVTVLIDPRRTSRYLVDVAVDDTAATFIQRVLRHLGTLAIVLGVGFVELVAIDAGQPDAPPGPVHGEVVADGARFGKGGLHWQPNLCRAATNPGVTAVALVRRDDVYPLAQIIADPSSNIAALDVQRARGEEMVRFLPSTCTRLHGSVARDATGRRGTLRGYADAECREDGADLTLHMDFAGCE